jgi:hypothetical protein
VAVKELEVHSLYRVEAARPADATTRVLASEEPAKPPLQPHSTSDRLAAIG